MRFNIYVGVTVIDWCCDIGGICKYAEENCDYFETLSIFIWRILFSESCGNC